jgi:hypothetical protein
MRRTLLIRDASGPQTGHSGCMPPQDDLGAPPHYYPVTVVTARYGGTYEPGRWLAFPLDPSRIPPAFAGEDVECMSFWSDYDEPVGGGDSPDDAYADLHRQLSQHLRGPARGAGS